MKPALVRSLAAATVLVASAFGPACTAECRADIDCPRSPELHVCQEGTCVPIVPTPIDEACDSAEDCVTEDGDRTCADGICQFVPTCQLLTADTYDVEASCEDGPRSGTGSASRNGCSVSLSIDLDDVTGVLELGEISAVDGPAVTDLDVAGCAEDGSFSTVDSALVLRGCDVDISTCDLVLIPSSVSGRPCFVDAADDGCCGPVQGLDASDVGVCSCDLLECR